MSLQNLLFLCCRDGDNLIKYREISHPQKHLMWMWYYFYNWPRVMKGPLVDIKTAVKFDELLEERKRELAAKLAKKRATRYNKNNPPRILLR